ERIPDNLIRLSLQQYRLRDRFHNWNTPQGHLGKILALYPLLQALSLMFSFERDFEPLDLYSYHQNLPYDALNDALLLAFRFLILKENHQVNKLQYLFLDPFSPSPLIVRH